MVAPASDMPVADCIRTNSSPPQRASTSERRKTVLRGVGKGAQYGVTRSMAMAVIDALEMIHVDQRQAKSLSRAQAALRFLLQQDHHVTAIQQAGQIIVRGHELESVRAPRSAPAFAAQSAANAAQTPGQDRDRGNDDTQHHEMR
jgi:hypothetical protein